MKKFFTLLLAFLIIFLPAMPAKAAFDVINATLTGRLDTNVSDSISAWGISELASASTAASIGDTSIIYMEFEEPVKFLDNVGIVVDIQVIGNSDAESTNAEIISIKVDGNTQAEKNISLLRNEDGYLFINLDAYDFAGIGPFSTIEIMFKVKNAPTNAEDTPVDETSEIQNEPVETPETPATPETPETPEFPTTPGIPETPETPEEPGLPGWVTAVVAAVIAAVFFVLIKSKKK